jgi:hypothetical protein
MDFTEIYRQSAGLVAFSPGAHFILTAVSDRLVVRRADTFHVSRSWQVPSMPSPSAAAISVASSRPVRPALDADGITQNVITHIAWSPDSEYVFAACIKLGLVFVFRMRDEEWSARIETGTEGLLRAEWAPDGRHVLCFSEWGVSHYIHRPVLYFSFHLTLSQLRVTIWSLVAGIATYIQYPLHPDRGTRLYAFGHPLTLSLLAKVMHFAKTADISSLLSATSQKIRSAYMMPRIHLT